MRLVFTAQVPDELLQGFLQLIRDFDVGNPGCHFMVVSESKMSTADALIMWTVYDHPRDFPNNYVARKSIINNGDVIATDEVMVCPFLSSIREALAAQGLMCITRMDDDDPKIVEVWL